MGNVVDLRAQRTERYGREDLRALLAQLESVFHLAPAGREFIVGSALQTLPGEVLPLVTSLYFDSVRERYEVDRTVTRYDRARRCPVKRTTRFSLGKTGRLLAAWRYTERTLPTGIEKTADERLDADSAECLALATQTLEEMARQPEHFQRHAFLY